MLFEKAQGTLQKALGIMNSLDENLIDGNLPSLGPWR